MRSRFHGRANAAVVLALLAACSGISARQHAQLPTMRLAWSALAAEVETGVVVDSAAGKLDAAGAALVRAASAGMTQALNAGDPAGIAAQPWSLLKASATAGIEADFASKKVGPGVVPSLKARVDAFEAALSKFLERT